jgi:hypothetical protein
VLALGGLGRATPTLTALGLIEEGQVCAVPLAPALMEQLAQRSGIELSEPGRRKLEGAPAARQGLIGRPIGGVIGKLIGSAPDREGSFSLSERGERPQHPPRPTIPGISRDSSDSLTPPPTPPAATGGGQQKLRKRQAGRPKPTATPIPETDATRLLRTIFVRPAQQIELAGMPPAAIESAIADGRARQGVRDLAGWVVYMLRQRRDQGWVPSPPAPGRARGIRRLLHAAGHRAGRWTRGRAGEGMRGCPNQHASSTNAAPRGRTTAIP